MVKVQALAAAEGEPVHGDHLDRVLAQETRESLRFIFNARDTVNQATADGAAGGFDVPGLTSLFDHCPAPVLPGEPAYSVAADDYASGYYHARVTITHA